MGGGILVTKRIKRESAAGIFKENPSDAEVLHSQQRGFIAKTKAESGRAKCCMKPGSLVKPSAKAV